MSGGLVVSRYKHEMECSGCSRKLPFESLRLVAAKRFIGTNRQLGLGDSDSLVFEYPYVCSRACAARLDSDWENHETTLRKPHLFEDVGNGRFVFKTHAEQLPDFPETEQEKASA